MQSGVLKFNSLILPLNYRFPVSIEAQIKPKVRKTEPIGTHITLTNFRAQNARKYLPAL